MRESRPDISVLIPCWNAQSSIARALASVLETTSIDLECNVVDDGSTDATVAIVRHIAERDPRVILLALDANVGVSAARNRGLELVRGEWLTLLDADDRLLPGGLRSLFETARSRNALAVVGQQIWSNGRRRWLGHAYAIPDIRRPGAKSLVNNPGLLYYASPHGKLLHRTCTAGLQFHGRVLGDQPWTIQALLRAGDRIEVIGETVYEWTRPGRHGISTITTRTRSSAALGVEVVEMAEIALSSVRREIDVVVPDQKRQHLVAAGYVERLLRSDVGGLVLRAVLRGDTATGALLAAVERFLRAVPKELLDDSAALPTYVLAPPLRHWYRLGADARTAYWQLFDVARQREPWAADRPRSRIVRAGLRMTKPGMSAARHALVSGLLSVAWGIEVGCDWVRARISTARRWS
jgi:hypothetical protein